MNNLYRFRVPFGPTAFQPLLVSAPSGDSASAVMRARVESQDLNRVVGPQDVTQAELRVDRFNLADMLRSRVTGVAVLEGSALTPEAMVAALFAGGRPGLATTPEASRWKVTPVKVPAPVTAADVVGMRP